MPVTITHTLVSAIADDGIAGEVGPSEWNDNHVISGAAFADAGFDVLFGWDDSAGQHKNMLLADILTEANPAAGDFILIYGAEGDLRKADWNEMIATPAVAPTDNALVRWDGATGALVQSSTFSLSDAGALSGTLTDASTNAASTMLTFVHLSTGTVTTGFGTRTLFQGENASNLLANAAAIDWQWTDATNSSEDAELVVSLQAAGSLAERLRISSLGAETHTFADTVTNVQTTQLTFTHNTTGTAAAGFGTRFLWNLEDAAGNSQAAAFIDVVWTDATNGSEDAEMVFGVTTGGAAPAEVFRFRGAATSGAIIPVNDNNIDLGTTAIRFEHLYAAQVVFNSGAGIYDDSGNEQLTFGKSASAVNYLAMTNAATGVAPAFSALGSDANVSMRISAQGNSNIILAIDGLDRVAMHNQAFFPVTNDGMALGGAGAAWADLFLAEGGTINFDSSDLVIAQSGNVLSITGGLLAGSSVDPANDTGVGTIEIAVQSEMETATDTTRAVTPGRQHYHPGMAKFWVVWTANSTTILASHNMTSIADTAVGDADGTIGVDFSGVNWSGQVSTQDSTTNGWDADSIQSSGFNARAAGTFGVLCGNMIDGGTAVGGLIDPEQWSVVGYGDIA